MQRYAAEIFRLQEDHASVTLSLLAASADTSLQATSRMIRRLKEAGLITHERYRGVRLTGDGERTALPCIRRHRLSEVFLVHVMGFQWEDVHDLADVLEPGINQVLEARMDEITGHPTHCPHGDPIPSRDGTLPALHDVCLADLEPGTTGKISRVRTHNQDMLRYLADLGMVPGVRFRLLARAPFNGPLRIGVGSQEQVLGRDLASTLWVNIGEDAPSGGPS